MSEGPDSRLRELVGVYHADGGAMGELKYVLGKLLGTAHCSLCDITHATVRRKAEWDAMATRLGVPFDLVHLNEVPEDVAPAVEREGSPLVVGRLDDGRVLALLDSRILDGLGGSVAAFETALRARIADL